MKKIMKYIGTILFSACALLSNSYANDSEVIAFAKLLVTASDNDIVEYVNLIVELEDSEEANNKAKKEVVENKVVEIITRMENDKIHSIAKCDEKQLNKDLAGFPKGGGDYEGQKYMISLPPARAACFIRKSFKVAASSSIMGLQKPPLSTVSDEALVEFNLAVHNRKKIMAALNSTEYEKLNSEVAVWTAVEKIQNEKNPVISRCDQKQTLFDVTEAGKQGPKDAMQEYILSLPQHSAACALRFSVKQIEQLQ